ncbi:uncharacterized protein A4U43_C06F17450 [Asparagus officinalis]|uniref:Uncharacterized protein n=1 Tax=Asparagus officinalis TaxID=4686 RepID=A0A5P1EMG6_ASPOF|nr:uncharacterized protein A4U43_C06F17450 [Asparagus officinalis]
MADGGGRGGSSGGDGLFGDELRRAALLDNIDLGRELRLSVRRYGWLEDGRRWEEDRDGEVWGDGKGVELVGGAGGGARDLGADMVATSDSGGGVSSGGSGNGWRRLEMGKKRGATGGEGGGEVGFGRLVAVEERAWAELWSEGSSSGRRGSSAAVLGGVESCCRTAMEAEGIERGEWRR